MKEARDILSELKKEKVGERLLPRNPFLPPPPTTDFDIGLVYLGLGEKEEAINWFEIAADERTAEIIHVKCEPIYDSLQNEDRFIALKKRIGV